MLTLWILFGLLQAAGIGFAFLSLWRLYSYIHRYRFDESKYTLLFRFVHLHWIATLYIGLSFFWIPVSYLIFTRL